MDAGIVRHPRQYIVRPGSPNTGLRIDMENPGCDEF
jgi:hypothetical protein